MRISCTHERIVASEDNTSRVMNSVLQNPVKKLEFEASEFDMVAEATDVPSIECEIRLCRLWHSCCNTSRSILEDDNARHYFTLSTLQLEKLSARAAYLILDVRRRNAK